MNKRVINEQESQIIIDAPTYSVTQSPEAREFINRTEVESSKLAREIMSKWKKDSK